MVSLDLSPRSDISKTKLDDCPLLRDLTGFQLNFHEVTEADLQASPKHILFHPSAFQHGTLLVSDLLLLCCFDLCFLVPCAISFIPFCAITNFHPLSDSSRTMILRPYFHALPLYHSELQNWRKYLEFEISEGHHNRIVTLYERCLVACAHYEEFWLSYAKYMENISVEETSSIFQRACQIHLPKKPTLNFEWAMFEEKHGNLDSARSILCDLETQVPRLAIVRMKRVNLERRNGNLEEAERLLQEAVEKSLGTELAAFYSIKLSRFLLKSREELERAKEVVIQALKEEPVRKGVNHWEMQTLFLDLV
ncbi:pre-mRNA-processing factor 39-like [Pelobates fuscus]|uniref:pre-mRNA-processing factor 39-like n=1 Tax=Pelobates fuscus TaxID=191477 RepID=UPI002FE45CDC